MKWIVKVAVLGVLAVISLEVGLRVRIAFQSHHRFEDDGLFRYLPNRQVGGSPELRTNSLGFFGDEMDEPKPENQVRVVVLGSSAITSPLLAASLQQELEAATGRDVIVNTAGIPRYTSYHNALIAERYLGEASIDVAVFYGGINDNAYNTFPDFAPVPYDGFVNPYALSRSVIYDLAYDKIYLKKIVAQRSFEPESSMNWFEQNLARVADALEGELLLVPIAPGWPTADDDLATIIVQSEGPMSHFWGVRDSALAGVEAHRDVMQALAEARDDVSVATVDEALVKNGATYHDLVHLTGAGIEILARELAEAIVPLLKDD